MSQNGQAHFKSLAAYAAIFFKVCLTILGHYVSNCSLEYSRDNIYQKNSLLGEFFMFSHKMHFIILILFWHPAGRLPSNYKPQTKVLEQFTLTLYIDFQL